jgi:hypothetical protein
LKHHNAILNKFEPKSRFKDDKLINNLYKDFGVTSSFYEPMSEEFISTLLSFLPFSTIFA